MGKVCGYTYLELEEGTRFTELPNSWRCPQCLAQKGVFYQKTQTIAGFAENQQYGFGTNEMTGEQKNGLILVRSRLSSSSSSAATCSSNCAGGRRQEDGRVVTSPIQRGPTHSTGMALVTSLFSRGMARRRMVHAGV